jgi:hypothetical protein
MNGPVRIERTVDWGVDDTTGDLPAGKWLVGLPGGESCIVLGPRCVRRRGDKVEALGDDGKWAPLMPNSKALTDEHQRQS